VAGGIAAHVEGPGRDDDHPRRGLVAGRLLRRGETGRGESRLGRSRAERRRLGGRLRRGRRDGGGGWGGDRLASWGEKHGGDHGRAHGHRVASDGGGGQLWRRESETGTPRRVAGSPPS